MTQLKHLTLVCYKSGYGGDFLCGLIDKALGNSSLKQRDGNNRYLFKNYVFDNCNQQIKSLHHIFSYYHNQDSVNVIDGLAGKVDWADDLKRIYNVCYDDEEEIFIENITQHIKDGMNLPFEFNVGNLHYMGQFKPFDISKIHDPMTIIYLRTDDELYFHYFHAFSQIKTNFSVLKNLKIRKKEFFDWKPLDNSLHIDPGKLFFEDTLDESISSILSNVIGKKIEIDTDTLKAYRDQNDNVLKEYFGDDYKLLDANSFRQKKLELFDKMSEIE